MQTNPRPGRLLIAGFIMGSAPTKSNGRANHANAKPRMAPHNPEAELAVLGCVVRDNSTIGPVRSILTAEHFYEDVNQRIFRAAIAIEERGEPVDIVTLAEELHRRNEIAVESRRTEKDVSYGRIAELQHAAPHPARATYYARIVREAALSRQLIVIGNRIAKDAEDRIGPPGELLDSARELLSDVDAGYQPTPKFPVPIPASHLQARSQDVAQVLQGFLQPGLITMFNALWKAGKTTWLSVLLRCLGNGEDFCGQRVTPTNVLYFTEEPEDIWIERRDRLGIGDHVHFVTRPFNNKPNSGEWHEFVGYVVKLLEERPAGLVVFDTLASVWPVKDENDASEVQAALMPLRRITDLGAALLPVHHSRKSDGHEATSARGSGALSAFVDVLLELRRYAPADRKDRRRVLTAYSRLQGTPDELVVELSEAGDYYAGKGDRVEASRRETIEVICSVLSPELPGLTVEEIREAWPNDDRTPACRTLQNELPKGVDAGHWSRSGDGRKGDPYRYVLRV